MITLYNGDNYKTALQKQRYKTTRACRELAASLPNSCCTYAEFMLH
jgi:hypothetical protein